LGTLQRERGTFSNYLFRSREDIIKQWKVASALHLKKCLENGKEKDYRFGLSPYHLITLGDKGKIIEYLNP